MSPSANSSVLISVVIPVYNRGAAIQKTLDSVLQQDLPPDEVEILVIDDGSTDETSAFLQQNYGDNPQVRLFSLSNGGVAKARNFGLQEARGEFIAYLDHDDIWLTSKLRLQSQMLQNRPECGVVYCKWTSVDEDLKATSFEDQITQQFWWKPQQGWVYPWIYCPHVRTHPRNPIISMSFPLMRTALVRSIGGFDPRTVPSDDWDLWIKLSQVTQFAYVDEVLVFYVRHAGQQHDNIAAANSSWLRIFKKHKISFLRYPVPWLCCKGFGDYIRCYKEYISAREKLFAKNLIGAWMIVLSVAIRRPFTVFSLQYAYLIYRLLRFNTNRY